MELTSAKKKLYLRASEDFSLPHWVNTAREPVLQSASYVPLLHWPDGRTCFDASLYVLELYSRGASREVGGGTLLTYSTKLSHLLRFAAANDLGLLDLTDSYFTLFINSLRAEGRVESAPVRTNSTVISIGRVCLDFLDWLSCQYGRVGFVDPEGNIRAERKSHNVPLGRGRFKVVRYWDHRAFGVQEAAEERSPISSLAISRLRKAVVDAKSSAFVRRRRQVMLKLLEITGGRRTEVAFVRVKDVYDARKMKEPALRLRTLKKKGGKQHTRLVPISAHDLGYLSEFIRLQLTPMLKGFGKGSLDDCCLLVSETTGNSLAPNTITQEVRLLRILAGITGPAHSHMFRHRYLTKSVLALLEQHKIENPDAFRQALIDQEALKTKLLQVSGHSSVETLDRYVHLAFEEYTKFKATYDLVKARMSILSFLGTVDEIHLEIERTGRAENGLARLKELLSTIATELQETRLSPDD